MSIHEEITNQIAEQLKAGVRPWIKPFNGGHISMPKRHNGLRYQGINILLLWMQQRSQPIWMTYDQAQKLGGQVRKGEKGTRIFYYGTSTNDENETFAFAKRYPVFNAEQIDDLPSQYIKQTPKEYSNPDILDHSVIKWVEDSGAVFTQGSSACYYPTQDKIEMPAFSDFKSGLDYYSALYHEFAHWTGHESRLKRDMSPQRNKYAFEELVAEMTSAFMMAEQGYEPTVRKDHAQYLKHWLDALNNDMKFIFRAATAATKAVEYLNTTVNNNQMKVAV